MNVPLGSAALLGIIQGFAELFPFSSLGLLVILPHIVHLNVPTQGARYLPFLVALHLGTAVALLLLFRHEWIAVVRGWFLWLKGQHTLLTHKDLRITRQEGSAWSAPFLHLNLFLPKMDSF
ncbi:undecaprenyl-diphosphate phosphatase [Sulfobacillus thermotolerans]|uniref:undecaprenyl-diphosphate phosphatase n=1 Tax=Sulfobacillus thermotolerans TaxID=338644 RepID=UPI0033688CAA